MHSAHKVISVAPRTWLGRAVTALVALGLLALGVFFFTFFLVLFLSVLVVVMVAWVLLPQRQRQRKSPDGTIDVEYTVVKSEAPQPDEGSPAESKRLDDRRSQEKQ